MTRAGIELLMLPLFSLLQWIGIFLTGLARGILGLLSFLFALVAGASFLLGISSGYEALKMLTVGFVLFILPHCLVWCDPPYAKSAVIL